MAKHKPTAVPMQTPEATPALVTFGVERVASERYLAIRFDGPQKRILTPARFRQESYGESKALAVQRLIEELRLHVRRRDL